MLRVIEGAFFLFGLAVGSFLNVLIDRLAKGESPFKGRSHCDHCRKTLSPSDLLPVVSFILLKGRCRYCKKKLSRQYPLIEVVTGCLFVFVGIYANSLPVCQLFGVSCQLYILSLLIISASFLVIFATDVKYQIIPDEMILSSLMGAALYVYVMKLSFLEHIAAGLICSGFFLLLYLLTKGKGMGLGDVKLAFVIGFLLGSGAGFIGLYLAFLTGAVVSIILILLKLKNRKDKIAFGPFLVSATLLSIVWGNKLLQWYTHLFQ